MTSMQTPSSRNSFLGFVFFVFLVAVGLSACGGDTGSGSAGSPDTGVSDGASAKGVLEPPMVFPSVRVESLDGEVTDTGTLLRGQYSIVVFVQIGCEACAEVMEIWKKVADEFPPEMHVIAVTEDEPDFARKYVEETGFPFPLYCDEKGVFHKRYRMNRYPSMVGVVDDGTIAYVGRPVTAEFTPQKAWKLLVDVMEARKAKAGGAGGAGSRGSEGP